MQTETAGPERVTFIELTGTDAKAVLARHGRSIAPTGAACELLASETQEHLYLLVCRGPLDATAVPAEARVWSFRTVEAYR